MSSENDTPLTDRLQDILLDNLDKIETVLHQYDEMEALLTASGQNAGGLKDAIKAAMESNLVLMGIFEDALTQLRDDCEAEEL